MTETWHSCKGSVENLEKCVFHHGNECEPLFLVNCFICDQNIWVVFGWNNQRENFGTWSGWKEKERQVVVIKIICGQIKTVQNQ